MKKYKVYVLNNGLKTLFHEGELDKETWRTIVAEIKLYFGWRNLTFERHDGEICVFNRDIVEQRRRRFFHSEVAL